MSEIWNWSHQAEIKMVWFFLDVSYLLQNLEEMNFMSYGPFSIFKATNNELSLSHLASLWLVPLSSFKGYQLMVIWIITLIPPATLICPQPCDIAYSQRHGLVGVGPWGPLEGCIPAPSSVLCSLPHGFQEVSRFPLPPFHSTVFTLEPISTDWTH